MKNNTNFLDQSLPTINILSIDGGGALGVGSIILLEEILGEAGISFDAAFDMVGGVSAGAIISLMLTMPKKDGWKTLPPKEQIQVINDKFTKFSLDLMGANFFGAILNGLRLIFCGYRFSEKKRIKVANELFGDASLQDASKPVVFSSILNSPGHYSPFIFKNFSTQSEQFENFYMKDVARALCAAPSYFSLALIKSLDGKDAQEYPLLDGALSSNSISLPLYLYASELFPGHKINIISIGNISSIKHVLSKKNPPINKIVSHVMRVVINSSIPRVHESLLLISNLVHNFSYYRINIKVSKSKLLCDTFKVNKLDEIKKYAREYTRSQEGRARIKEIAQILRSSRGL